LLVFRRLDRRGLTLTASGRADRLITHSGATTPATKAAAMPLPLTDREREIATLSARTLEGHIYRACARVGAATRTELAQLIIQFAPPHVRGQN
jgi:hypothetical protein